MEKANSFVARAIDLAMNKETLYVQGGWGQTLTDDNKIMFVSNPMWPYNQEPDRIEKIMAADIKVIAVDCVCSIKSLIDKLIGVNDQTTAMRKPCPDVTICDMLADCSKISSNIDTVIKGEFLSYADYSHCGIYVGVINGRRMAFEATHRFSDGAQLIDIDRPERRGMWAYHGRMPYIDYADVTPSVVVDTSKLKNMVTQKVKARQGDKGDYVAEIQRILIAKGFSCGSYGADGVFGSATTQAVKNFQAQRKLEADGIVGYDTITRLIGV